MAKEGGNVKAFNMQVLSIVCRVKRRGTDPGSILPQLLRVYMSVDDKDGKFARYIENLNNNYIDGTINLDDTVLMSKTEVQDQGWKDLSLVRWLWYSQASLGHPQSGEVPWVH